MCPAARSRVARIFSSAVVVGSGNSVKLSVLARSIGFRSFPGPLWSCLRAHQQAAVPPDACRRGLPGGIFGEWYGMQRRGDRSWRVPGRLRAMIAILPSAGWLGVSASAGRSAESTWSEHNFRGARFAPVWTARRGGTASRIGGAATTGAPAMARCGIEAAAVAAVSQHPTRNDDDFRCHQRQVGSHLRRGPATGAGLIRGWAQGRADVSPIPLPALGTSPC